MTHHCEACKAQGVTAAYEADFILREAQSQVALELTYENWPYRQNSHEVAELAMGVLGNVRRYLDRNYPNGITIPGLYTSAIYSRVMVDESNPSKPIYKMEWEVMGDESKTDNGEKQVNS